MSENQKSSQKPSIKLDTEQPSDIRSRSGFMKAMIVLTTMLGILFIGFYFLNQKISTWEVEKNYQFSFKSIYPKLFTYYQDEQYNTVLKLVDEINGDYYSDDEIFKVNLLVAATFKKQGYFLSALEAVKKAEKIKKTTFSITLKGMILEKIGKQKQAESSYLEVVQRDKNFYPGYEKLGDLYYQTSKLQKSIDYYQKAKHESLNQDYSTANNVILIKKIIAEYLNNGNSFSRVSLDELKLFQETRFFSLVSIIQGLTDLEFVPQTNHNPNLEVIENRKTSLNFFERSVKVADKEKINYYLTFLGLLHFYLQNVGEGKRILNTLLDSEPFVEEQGLFPSIVYETMGDYALHQKKYELTKYYYNQIFDPIIKQDPTLIRRYSLLPDRKKKGKNFVLNIKNADNSVENIKFNDENYFQIAKQLNRPVEYHQVASKLNFAGFIEFSSYLEKRRYWNKLYLLLKSYIANNKNPPPFLIKKTGDVAVHYNQLKEAEKWYELVIRESGDLQLIAETYNNLARVLIMQGKKDEAMKHLFTAIEIKSLPFLYYNLALVQKADGNTLDYFYSLQKAKSILSKNYTAKLAARIYLELSYIYTYAKVFDRAKFFLEKAEAADLGYAELHNWQGKMMLMKM